MVNNDEIVSGNSHLALGLNEYYFIIVIEFDLTLLSATPLPGKYIRQQTFKKW